MSDDNKRPLQPEDYAEPRCLLNGEAYGKPRVQTIPRQRIIEKLDAYTGSRDYAGAEKLLLYWMEEAEQGRDQQGKLMLLNELIGLYRKSERRDQALSRVDEALALLRNLDLEDSITGGTTFVNAATACSAFGENERALELFRRAKGVYEGSAHTGPDRLGGLYNNMALACAALGRYEEAFRLFGQAMEQMEKTGDGALEQAITLLNMADTAEAQAGTEAATRIRELLDRAWGLLRNASVPRDGYFAFVCEKCAPGFEHHGRPEEGALLRRTAEEIYDGT